MLEKYPTGAGDAELRRERETLPPGRAKPAQGQLPLPVTACGEVCPAHSSSQEVAPVQLTEQELVQVTVQLEPAAHETLPLSPTVTLHEEFALQLTLQLLPHEPVHVA